MGDSEGGVIRADAPVERSWCVVNHRSRVVDLTVRQLLQEGFEFYRPMVQRLKRVDTRRVSVSEPLYRDYMFVRRVQPGKATLSGIYGVISRDLGRVTDGFIARHRVREEMGFIRVVAEAVHKPRGLRVNDRVQVAGLETVDGLLEAVVMEIDPVRRAAKLALFMAGAGEMVVPIEKLIRVRRVAGCGLRD